MNTHIYTPRLKSTDERLRVKLNDTDWAIANRYRGTLRVKGIVTDQKTGKRYRIKGRGLWSSMLLRCHGGGGLNQNSEWMEEKSNVQAKETTF